MYTSSIRFISISIRPPSVISLNIVPVNIAKLGVYIISLLNKLKLRYLLFIVSNKNTEVSLFSTELSYNTNTCLILPLIIKFVTYM